VAAVALYLHDVLTRDIATVVTAVFSIRTRRAAARIVSAFVVISHNLTSEFWQVT